jgi:hypothetical protein
MFKKVVISAVVVGVAALVYTSLPDIRRYWRMRNM